MSPRKPQTLSDTPSDARPDAPSHTRIGKTMTMQNDSKAPFKVNAKVSLTLKVWGRYGTQNRAKRTAEHSQNAPRTFIARKFLATSIPAVNGNVQNRETCMKNAKNNHQPNQCCFRQSPDYQCIYNIANVFKEKRPAWPVQRKHFSIATYFIAASWSGWNHEHGTQHGQHYR